MLPMRWKIPGIVCWYPFSNGFQPFTGKGFLGLLEGLVSCLRALVIEGAGRAGMGASGAAGVPVGAGTALRGEGFSKSDLVGRFSFSPPAKAQARLDWKFEVAFGLLEVFDRLVPTVGAICLGQGY